MRITQKQLVANRKNATKSTGPKTKEGKQIVAQNSIKHGLYTRALILNSPVLKDELTDYNSLIYALDSDLQPDGLFEEYLVRKIANCIWRSRLSRSVGFIPHCTAGPSHICRKRPDRMPARKYRPGCRTLY